MSLAPKETSVELSLLRGSISSTASNTFLHGKSPTLSSHANRVGEIHPATSSTTTTMHASSIRSALASAFQIPLRPSTQSKAIRTLQPARLLSLSSRSTNGLVTTATPKSLAASVPSLRSSFSTTAARSAKKGKGAKKDQRISEWLDWFGGMRLFNSPGLSPSAT